MQPKVSEGLTWFVFGVVGFETSALFINFLAGLTAKPDARGCAAAVPGLFVLALSCASNVVVAIAAFKLGILSTMLA